MSVSFFITLPRSPILRQVWAVRDGSPTDLRLLTRPWRNPDAMKNAGVFPSCYESKAISFCCRLSRMLRLLQKISFGNPLIGRNARKPCPGNYERLRVLPGLSGIRAE